MSAPFLVEAGAQLVSQSPTPVGSLVGDAIRYAQPLTIASPPASDRHHSCPSYEATSFAPVTENRGDRRDNRRLRTTPGTTTGRFRAVTGSPPGRPPMRRTRWGAGVWPGSRYPAISGLLRRISELPLRLDHSVGGANVVSLAKLQAGEPFDQHHLALWKVAAKLCHPGRQPKHGTSCHQDDRQD